MSDSAVRVENLSKVYQLGGEEVHALRSVTLDFPPGDYVAIMGESGVGKSTLLNLVAGLDIPDGGELRIGGVKIFSDGSLIGRTAAMFEPFFSDDGTECGCGMFQTEPQLLKRLIIDAHRSGWQVGTHAIGDRAVATVQV